MQGLAEGQAKIGHEVEVLTSNCLKKNQASVEILNAVTIHRINSRRLRYPDLTFPKSIPLDLLKKADIVHVHGHNSIFSQRVLLQAKKLGIKTACYFMAVDAFKDHPNLVVRSFAPYYGRKNTQNALAASDLILVKSLRDQEILRKAYSVNAEYLPDAVQSTMLTYKKQLNAEFTRQFKIKQPFFFLFIGRMHKLKGPHILVNALKYNENIAGVFIGPDGGYLKETECLAKKLRVSERTYCLGFVDEETKMAAIDSSVALILPSIADYVEVYPGVISEAWAREKPVIASNVGGIPYRVKDHLNGLLVPPSNPKRLSQAMLELITKKSVAQEMGIAGRSEVHTWESIADKSIVLYERTLKE